MNIRTEIIAHNSDAYREEIDLRMRVLRAPLGLTFTPEQLAAEAGNLHIAVYLDDRMAGCLMLQPEAPDDIHQAEAGAGGEEIEPDTAKMRQVAVDTPLQGQGIGRVLVTFAEEIARQHGYRRIRLAARESAIPFYTRLGYTPHGDLFDEVTLPHLEMRKLL